MKRPEYGLGDRDWIIQQSINHKGLMYNKYRLAEALTPSVVDSNKLSH